MNTATTKRLQRTLGFTTLGVATVLVAYFVRDASAQNPANLTQANPAPAGATTPVVNPSNPAIQNAANMQNAFAEVARVAEPAVVTITTEAKRRARPALRPGQPNGGIPKEFEDLLRQFQIQPNSFGGDKFVPEGNKGGFVLAQGQGNGSSPFVDLGEGSGLIYDAKGLIITNAHVVAGADAVNVKLADGREFKNAKVLGADEQADIAVIQINGTNFPTVKLGDSSKVNVGDWAIAVGNPFGLENTLTVGVISAKAREVAFSAYGPGDYFQTDASINPGNSGGPLLDIYGRVIAVNNAIYTRSGGNVGIGFAIPINTAKEIADQLATSGKVRRARLGISMNEVGDNAAALGLPAGTKGALVLGVEPNAPAAKAGVQVGDVITGFNGNPVTRSADLQRKVAFSPVGKLATLNILRAGKPETLSITPEELPTRPTRRPTEEKAEPVPARRPSQQSAIGVRLAPIDNEARTELSIPKETKGVLIAEVREGSPADLSGLQRGDLITRIGQKSITTPEEGIEAIRSILDAQPKSERGKSVALFLTRGGDSQYVVVTVAD